MIGIAEKSLDEVEGANEEKNRHRVRREFWTELLKAMAGKTALFQNISPSVQGWIGAASGIRGIAFNFVAGEAGGRAEMYIDRSVKNENKFVFDTLFANREAIEADFGGQLVWERLDEKQACRIKAETAASIYERDQSPALLSFLTGAMLGWKARSGSR